MSSTRECVFTRNVKTFLHSSFLYKDSLCVASHDLGSQSFMDILFYQCILKRWALTQDPQKQEDSRPSELDVNVRQDNARWNIQVSKLLAGLGRNRLLPAAVVWLDALLSPVCVTDVYKMSFIRPAKHLIWSWLATRLCCIADWLQSKYLWLLSTRAAHWLYLTWIEHSPYH